MKDVVDNKVVIKSCPIKQVVSQGIWESHDTS